MANDDEIKGKAENLKGRAKQAVGTVFGNKEMEAEGAVKEKVGEVKRKLDEPADEEETEEEEEEKR